MRKLYKNILVFATATVLVAGSAVFAACDEPFTPLAGDDYKSTEAAVSNGGFAVEYGKYVYFINGATTYEDENTFGTPVKGALMRISKENLKKGAGEAETVLPSLIVSADYTAGFFIYKDRVYYATPNNVKSMSGETEKDWIEFKSASLNGSDVVDYFRLADNATAFRFVQTDKDSPVYLLYNGKKPDDNDGTSGIQSYNTETKTCTTIAEGASAYVFNSVDKTDPYVYYTMAVKDLSDSDAPVSLGYNQIYRARADVKEAPYTYTWDQKYLDEHDGKAPYLNLGTLVLDGVGRPTEKEDGTPNLDELTQFTHDYKKGESEPLAPLGYTYTLQSYTNSGSEYSGIYFTRNTVTTNSSSGVGASLYYLSAGEINKDGWNTITGNKDRLSDSAGFLDVVAKPTETANASASAIFYLDEEGHHYIYVKDANMIRADVKADASVEEQEIWYDASGATLVRLDDSHYTAQEPYKYVWFTRTNGSGMSVERAVYNGKAENYETLGFIGAGGADDGTDANAPYKALKILNLQHKSSWYPYETIADTLLFADAESVGDTSYDYIGTVSLTDKNGKYLNNAEFEKSVNDKWDSVMDSNAKTGYFAKLSSDGKSNLSSALTYYFRTGKTDLFYSNIQDAIDLGKKDNYCYTEDEKTAFKNFTENKEIENTLGENDKEKQFLDEENVYYRTRSYFIKPLGTVREADNEAMENYWKGYLRNYTPTEEEEKEGLEDWELALAIGVPVLAIAVAGAVAWYVLSKKKRAASEEEKPERMRVDTTDDRDLDVYGNGAESEETDGKDEE